MIGFIAFCLFLVAQVGLTPSCASSTSPPTEATKGGDPNYKIGDLSADLDRSVAPAIVEVAELKDHRESVFCVSFSADGSQAASAGGGGSPSSSDFEIRIWSIGDRKVTQRLTGHTGIVRSIMFFPDGRHLASASDDSSILIWDLTTGQVQSTLLGHSSGVSSIDISADGQQLLSGSNDKTMRLWSVADAREVRRYKDHVGAVNAVAFLTDGQAASGSSDTMIRLWNLSPRERVAILEGHPDEVVFLSHPLGSELVSAGTDGQMLVWEADRQNFSLVTKYNAHDGAIWGFAVSSDGKRAITCGEDSAFRWWDLEKQTKLAEIPRSKASLWGLAYSRDGTHALAAGADGIVRLYELRSE